MFLSVETGQYLLIHFNLGVRSVVFSLCHSVLASVIHVTEISGTYNQIIRSTLNDKAFT